MKQAKQFSALIDTVRGKHVAVVPHTHADLDAVTSAYVISTFLNVRGICNADILLQDYPNKDASKFLSIIRSRPDEFGEVTVKIYNEIPHDNQVVYDGFILVDTNSYELAPILKGKTVFGVIDHHNPVSFDISTDNYIYDSGALADAELIGNILLEFDPLPSRYIRPVSIALALGIISDTARFRSGKPETFELLADLIRKSGMTYEDLRIMSHEKRDEVSRLAILSSLKKTSYRIVNGYIIATSEASNSEADVASLLTDDIADVAFVARWVNEDKRTRISARAGVDFPIPLNTVMNKVAEALGGKGGGHPKAAGAGVPVHSDVALSECVNVITDEISVFSHSSKIEN